MERLHENLKETIETIEPMEVLENNIPEVSKSSNGTIVGVAIGAALVLGAYGIKKLMDKKKAKLEMEHMESVETVEEEIEEIIEDEIQDEE